MHQALDSRCSNRGSIVWATMDQGVSALIIVCGFVLGIGCLGISWFRRRRQHQREIEDVVRRLGGRWADPGAEVPPQVMLDPLSGSPYSNTDRPYDRGFWAEYRGRTVLGMEFTIRTHSTTSGTQKSRRYVVKVLGLQLPTVVLRPQRDIPAELWQGLQAIATGTAEFDDRYDVRAADRHAALQLITPAVFAWLMGRSEPMGLPVTSSASGLETTGAEVLPGWTTTAVLNQLCDLADLVQYGAVQQLPRLEQQTTRPPGNRVLSIGGIALCVAAAVFWIGAFTISDPSGGLVVILVILGLVGGGIAIERMLNRKARRMRSKQSFR